MRALVLIAFLFLFSCEPASSVDQISLASATPEPSPTPEDLPPIVPEIPFKALNKQQRKELDATLPLKLREVLEKAESLEVLGLSSEDKVGIGWYPDVSVSLPIGDERTQLLQAFYFDASAGPNPSACFLPRHGLKASYKGKTIELIICFQCHLFTVRGEFGNFDGGVYLNGSASHHIFEQLLQEARNKMKQSSGSVFVDGRK